MNDVCLKQMFLFPFFLPFFFGRGRQSGNEQAADCAGEGVLICCKACKNGGGGSLD